MPTYHAIVTWEKEDGTFASRLHTIEARNIAKAAWAVEDEMQGLTPPDARITMISEKTRP